MLGTTIRAPAADHAYQIDGVSVQQVGLSVWEKACLAPYLPLYYPAMHVALPPIAACLERHLYPHAQHADLIHNIRIGREGFSYAAYQAARKRDIPFALTPVHHPRWVGWRYQAYNRLYTLADLVFTLTETEKHTMIQLGVREERIAVIGHGPILADQADPQAFRQQHQIAGPMVLFLGQHYPYKGYQHLLQAAPLVWNTAPEAHFVFIGPPVGQSEHHFASYADPRIHHLGRVGLQDKTNALAACTLLCVPSTQESFGGVYTEAWSFRKPVIGCPIPAVSEVIHNGVDGFLVEQQAPQIAERIREMLLHPAQAQAMGQAGYQKVARTYTWEHIAQRTEQAYTRVIG